MKYLLVDGTNIVIRYAFASLAADRMDGRRAPSASEIESVLKSVERAIRDCATKAECSHAIVALDSTVDSWRKEIYADYKKGRGTITRGWSASAETFFTKRLWMSVQIPTQEGDDLIATLVARLHAAGKQSAILSGDSDLLQCLAPEGRCQVFQFGRNGEPRFVERQPAYVVGRYAVEPVTLRLYKALVGETTDHIAGVVGVGPKKAIKLLELAGNHLPSLRELLRHHSGTAVEEFDLAIALVTLSEKVPIPSLLPSNCLIPDQLP